MLTYCLAVTCLYWMGRTTVLAFLKTGFRQQTLDSGGHGHRVSLPFFTLGLLIAVMGVAAFEA